jgi:hypothetical protein
MKSEMLKRLVRAIAMGAQEDLNRFAETIVDGERRSGHERLARELESILGDRSKAKRTSRVGIDSDRSVRSLPISRRSQELLVSVIP